VLRVERKEKEWQIVVDERSLECRRQLDWAAGGGGAEGCELEGK
jgi:hypothetical protein